MHQSLERTFIRRAYNRPLHTYIKEKRIFFLLKRLLDIIISAVVSFFLISILIPIITVFIKLESRGPVFFLQRRVGRGGKSFLCIKFRTMVQNKNAHVQQATENDERITAVGKFLRKTNLDEFPQFFNVLIGDMSVVGPRPHMFSDCEKFSFSIPAYKFRSIVRPGITGLAQSKGHRGPTNDFRSMFHRYQLDAFYVRNANFLLDVRIIRQTAAQTFAALLQQLSLFVSVGKVQYRKAVTFFL